MTNAPNLQHVVKENTFKEWRDRTNEIIDALKEVDKVGERGIALDKQFEYDQDVSGTLSGTDTRVVIRGGYFRDAAYLTHIADYDDYMPANNDRIYYIASVQAIDPSESVLNNPVPADLTAIMFGLPGTIPTAGIIPLYRIKTGVTGGITEVKDLRTWAINSETAAAIAIPVEEPKYGSDGVIGLDGYPVFELTTITTNDGIAVYIDGVRQTQTLNYEVLDSTHIKVFHDPAEPLTADNILTFVARDLTGVVSVEIVTTEHIEYAATGGVFDLSATALHPVYFDDLTIYIGGVRQAKSLGIYSVTNSIVTFVSPIVTPTDILFVKTDVETPSIFRQVPAGGDAGDVMFKDSGVDYDTKWANPLHRNLILNGGMTVANGAASYTNGLTTAFQELTIDNMLIKQSVGTSDVQKAVYAPPFSTTGWASLNKVKPSTYAPATATSLFYRWMVDAETAAALENNKGTFTLNIKQESGSDANLTARIFRVLTGAYPSDYDSLEAVATFVSPAQNVPHGTNTKFRWTTSTVTSCYNGFVVELQVDLDSSLAAGDFNVYIADVDLRIGDFVRKFETKTQEEDMALLMTRYGVGKIEMFPVGNTAPRGYHLCDGGEYLKADYPRLNKFLGGAFDLPTTPSNKFRVPDYRDLFPRFANLGLSPARDPNALDVSFNAITTASSPVLTGVATIDIVKLHSGIIITGPGIPANTTVLEINRETGTVVLSANATANSGTPISLTAISRIRDDGTTGPVAGTVQQDSSKQHTHTVVVGGSGSTGALIGNGTAYTDYSKDGGLETRPKNVSLVPCIKF